MILLFGKYLLVMHFECNNLPVISCLVLFKQITVTFAMCIDMGRLHSAGNILLIESKSTYVKQKQYGIYFLL